MLRDVTGISDFDACIRRGYEYYVANFICDDGTVKYYNNNLYPIDMHSFAQAIVTLLKVGKTPSDLAVCNKIINRKFS
jgi:hypothetical protein